MYRLTLSILFPFTFLLFFTFCKSDTSGRRLTEQAITDSITRRYLDKLDRLVPNRKFEEAVRTADTLKMLAERYHSPQLQFEYLKAMGFVWSSRGALDSALSYYKRAEALLPGLDSTEKHRNRLNLSVASVYKNQEKWSSAFEAYKAVYDLKEKNGDRDISMVAYNLGTTAKAMGNRELAKRYLLEAFALPATNMVKAAIASSLEHLYMDAGDIDSAKYYFDNYVLPDITLVSPFWRAAKEEKRALFLAAAGNNDSAILHYLKALDIQREEGGSGLAKTYFNVADRYFYNKQYGRALAYADSSLVASGEQAGSSITTDVNLEAQALLLKAKVQQQTGDSREAASNMIRFYDRYMQYADSAYAIKAKELEQQYDTKAKDQQIIALARENESAQKINRQQKIISGGTLVILLLLSLFGVVYYRRSKLKDRLQQTELQQKLLHSQLEPHFVFNTLSILQSFIRSNQTEKATKYLSNFSGLLRSNLENSRKGYISLEDEIATLESYLQLQSMRTGANFEYEIHYSDEEAATLYVYPMMIQPFVENALQHGFREVSRKGRLLISIRRTERFLECVIDDNGSGMSRLAGKRPYPQKSSLSIQIIKERLDLLNKKTGRSFMVILQDKAEIGLGEGTLVRLQLPYVFQD